jgi:hypothetical protein
MTRVERAARVQAALVAMELAMGMRAQQTDRLGKGLDWEGIGRVTDPRHLTLGMFASRGDRKDRMD